MATVPHVPPKLPTLMLALAIVLGTAAGVGAATATWDANTDPDVAGYKLSYGTQSGLHTVVLDVGKVTTYKFHPPAGQRYYVVVQAYNTAGELSGKSAEVVVDIPLTTQPGAFVPQPGASVPPTPVPVPSQPPAPTPTPSPSPTPTPSPAPVPYQPLPGVPNPTPDTPLRLVQPTNQTSTLNATVVLHLTGGHIGNTAFTFSAAGLPPGLSLDSVSGVISGTPRAIGFYRVTIAVSDGTSSAVGDFGWAIVDTEPAPPRPNQPPALIQPGERRTALNEIVAFALSAKDPEGRPLTFTAEGLPPGLSIDRSSGLISGTATTLGMYQVAVTASDGELSTGVHFRWAVVESAASTRASEADSDKVQDYVDVSGDFDGDGRNDLATYRKSSSEWRIWTSGSNFATPTVMVWGVAGDRPVAADYNGDRVTDFAVYRPSTGTWHLSLSGTQTPLALQWGGPEDVPVPLDHDGDGKADLALIRGGGYEILLSSSNYLKSVRVY